MERSREAYPPLAKHCAMLLIAGEWRHYKDPTIGELQSLRRKGAVILHLITEKRGSQVDRTWVTDSGTPVVVSTQFLTCEEQRR